MGIFRTTEGNAQPAIRELVVRAGNAGTDTERLEYLKKLRALPEISDSLRAETGRLIEAIERWLAGPRLDYFASGVFKEGDFDFGVSKDSPLYPLTDIYRARMLFWVTLEYGGYWSHPEKRREQFDRIRTLFERLREAFPENRLVGMYLGEQVPPDKTYAPLAGAPAWATHEREGLERLADIIAWWIDNRMQESGEYGGGWGDDCEMWRWWVPVLIAFDDPKITEAQQRFSTALMNQEHMKGGYTNHMYDVEHTAEDSSDAVTPMMFLKPDDDAWSARALRLAGLMEELWTGTNDRGHLQFKSTYFSAAGVSEDPRKACDTVYHARAVQPALLYWQRTGDARMKRLFSAWMDTWVDAAARAERGKPAGIIPSAIHWPEGAAGGLGKTWWNPENHSSDPLYVWPSAMQGMLSTLLLTYHMTQDSTYLAPIRTMAAARMHYLNDPREKDPEPGTEAWCASKLGLVSEVAAKYRFLTGGTDFDGLLDADGSAYVSFRLHGKTEQLCRALEANAKAFRFNFPGYTSEVRFTDRVLRFPAVFQKNGMYAEGVAGVEQPDTGLLYACVTGDPGSAGYFPLGAVRWLTPPREIAALVVESGRSRFEAELFHFGEQPRLMEAELYLLDPGEYTFSVAPKSAAGPAKSASFTVGGPRTRIGFELPARTLCLLHVEPAAKVGREKPEPAGP